MASVNPEVPQGGQGRRYTKVGSATPPKGGRRRKGDKAIVNVNGDVRLTSGGSDVLVQVVQARGLDAKAFMIDYGYNQEAKTISVHVHKPFTPDTVQPTRSRNVFTFNVESVFNACEALRPVTRISCRVMNDYDEETEEPVLAILLGTGIEKRVIKRGPRKKKSEKEKAEKEKVGPTGSTDPEDEDEPEEEDDGELEGREETSA